MALKKKPVTKVPVGALRLTQPEGSCKVQFSDPGDGGESQKITSFEMVGYSGGVIPNHWYWGNLLIDLSGMQFSKDKYPILRDHETDKELGFATKPTINDQGMLFTEKNTTFLNNEEAARFIENSKAGFPYQASIRAEPTRILRLAEGEEATANGHTVKGPGTVWRQSIFKECSVCVFGYDSNTSSAVFSEDGESVGLTFSEEQPGNVGTNAKEENMPLTKFKSENPELYTALMKEAKDSVETEFKARLEQADTEKVQLTKQVDTAAAQIKTLESSVQALTDQVKKDRILAAAATAKSLCRSSLEASTIHSSFHDKVEAAVPFQKFMKDDSLDVVAFEAAVKAEIEDWQGRFGKIEKPSVLGFSSEAGSIDAEFALSDEDKAQVEAMSRFIKTGKE